ncbi:MAG TPA: hypothetical protein VFV50_02535 [Bdellovibrionales bacterium]|nr:hypothetical protein [Bdellovibrionales bacterium]
MKLFRRLSIIPAILATIAQPVQGTDLWQPVSQGAFAKRPAPTEPPKADAYREAILKAQTMTGDQRTRTLVEAQGLNIMNVTWEDTGRYKGSSVGPNISDMTIQVGVKKPGGDYDLTLMPVIRYNNYEDKTADLDPRQFTLLVGNEKGKDLKRISLREFLEDPTKYLHNARSWLNPKKSLLADRDTRVLVSAQACFLPVPKEGKAEFNPVLFNYQSVSGDPAVLSILVTRQGTSTTIIDNKRDASYGAWGQRLFHNQNGQRASLTGQRMSDFANTKEGQTVITDKANLDVKKSSGLNMVLLIQVPLKQKERPHRSAFGQGIAADMAMPMAAMKKSAAKDDYAEEESDVEAAVIGHGDFEGPYTEIADLSIERDTRFPVRVTVQFYKATATGVASAEDIKQIKQEIDTIYSQGDAVGSLVVAGETGRPTEYEGSKVQPPHWWDEFWERHERNTGETRAQAISRLKKLMGDDYRLKPVSELYVAEKLRKEKRRSIFSLFMKE